MSVNFNIFFCEESLSGFIVRKLSRDKKYHLKKFDDYGNFLDFLESNKTTSLFEHKSYIYLLNDVVINDKDLFLNYNFGEDIIITNKFINIKEIKYLNLLAKNLSRENYDKLIRFMINNVNTHFIEKLLELNNFDLKQLCFIFEYMDITNSELPFNNYIRSIINVNTPSLTSIIDCIEGGEAKRNSLLWGVHPGAIALYLQKKNISSLKGRLSKNASTNLISLYENDKYVKLQPNEANYMLKLRFLIDKVS